MIAVLRIGVVLACVAALSVACATQHSAGGQAATAGQIPCENLTGVNLPNTEIMSAQVQPAGEEVEGARVTAYGRGGGPISGLPTFCRVIGAIHPEPGSNIRFEVWLPSEAWTGRMFGAGNGAFAGSISYRELAGAVTGGEVGVSTDTGHTSNDSSWGVGRPELVRDFTWRGIHLSAVAAKAITEAFYGRQPDYSYFMACSNGGRQALIEAARFPDDYDGILAGAPASPWTSLGMSGIHNVHAQREPGSALRNDQMAFLQEEVLRQCDPVDGVTDGLVADPRACQFDYARLSCGQASASQCFSDRQIQTLRSIVAGPHDSSGAPLVPGYPLAGAETLWSNMIPAPSLVIGLAQGTLDHFIQEPFTTVEEFDFDRDPARLRAAIGSEIDASPDLSRFFSRGGKLILFHGWADPAIPPEMAIEFYEQALQHSGSGARDAMRLFMLPGVGHCGGGPGPLPADQAGPPSPGQTPERSFASALRAWVETGRTPETIVAEGPAPTRDAEATPASTRERLICAYPGRAMLSPGADPDRAASYTCSR